MAGLDLYWMGLTRLLARWLVLWYNKYIIGGPTHGWWWKSGSVVVSVVVGWTIDFDRFSAGDGLFPGTHLYPTTERPWITNMDGRMEDCRKLSLKQRRWNGTMVNEETQDKKCGRRNNVSCVSKCCVVDMVCVLTKFLPSYGNFHLIKMMIIDEKQMLCIDWQHNTRSSELDWSVVLVAFYIENFSVSKNLSHCPSNMITSWWLILMMLLLMLY